MDVRPVANGAGVPARSCAGSGFGEAAIERRRQPAVAAIRETFPPCAASGTTGYPLHTHRPSASLIFEPSPSIRGPGSLRSDRCEDDLPVRDRVFSWPCFGSCPTGLIGHVGLAAAATPSMGKSKRPPPPSCPTRPAEGGRHRTHGPNGCGREGPRRDRRPCPAGSTIERLR